jgi:hypothetical protein
MLLALRPLPVARQPLLAEINLRGIDELGIDIPSVRYRFLRLGQGAFQRDLLSGCNDVARGVSEYLFLLAGVGGRYFDSQRWFIRDIFLAESLIPAPRVLPWLGAWADTALRYIQRRQDSARMPVPCRTD